MTLRSISPLVGVLLLLSLALTALGMCVGNAGFENLIGLLLHPDMDSAATAMAQQIVGEIRLPRTLGVWTAGALLGLAGPRLKGLAAAKIALKSTQSWDWRERSLGQLSGGERQRVLLARALAVQAQVLLMDESLANLDPPHQADWLGVVRCLLETGVTVVSVLHEISMALRADQMVIMASGCVTHQGVCTGPATHRALEAVFDRRLTVYPLADQWVALPH